jgi:hypothetical protein
MQSRNRTQRGASKSKKNGNQSKTTAPQGVSRLMTDGKSQFGFPHKLLSKLRYCDTNPVVSTLGGMGRYFLRWNSTFDPDITSAGHQPLFRDTFAAIYDHYAVVSATLVVTVVNTGTVPLICGVVTDDDSSSSTLASTLMEQSNGVHKLLPAQAGSLSSHTFTVDWDCKRVLGIDPYASETYKTAVGVNPSEESTCVIWSQPVDLATSATTYITYELQQVVVWTELTTPTQS